MVPNVLALSTCIFMMWLFVSNVDAGGAIPRKPRKLSGRVIFSKHKTVESVNCFAYSTLEMKKVVGKVDELKPALIIKMTIPQRLLRKLMVSNYQLSCSANCTHGLGNCQEKKVTLQKAQNTLGTPSSLINLSVDMGRKNIAKCLGLTDFFEPHQKPHIIFKRADAKTAVLTCSLFVDETAFKEQRSQRGFWDYMLYGIGFFILTFLMVIACSVCSNDEPENAGAKSCQTS